MTLTGLAVQASLTCVCLLPRLRIAAYALAGLVLTCCFFCCCLSCCPAQCAAQATALQNIFQVLRLLACVSLLLLSLVLTAAVWRMPGLSLIHI